MDHGHDELSRPLKILKKKERKESVLLAQFIKAARRRERRLNSKNKNPITRNHINNVNNINTEHHLYQYSHSRPSAIPSISRFYVESYFLHFFL